MHVLARDYLTKIKNFYLSKLEIEQESETEGTAKITM
jgi:hypothetical protein